METKKYFIEYFIVISGMVILLISIIEYFSKKKLKFLENELKSKEQIINKIVTLDPEMKNYREILLTKSIPELNHIYKVWSGVLPTTQSKL